MNIAKIKSSEPKVIIPKKRFFLTEKNLTPIMVAGMFIGVILCFFFYRHTHIQLGQLLKIYLAFAGLMALIPYKKMVHILVLNYYHMLVGGVLGAAPFFTGMFLVCNFYFASNPVVHNTKITDFRRSKVPFENNYAILKVSSPVLDEPRKFRLFDYGHNYKDLCTHDSLEFTLSDGLFGYKVIKDCRIH